MKKINRKKSSNRILAFILILVMVFSYIPYSEMKAEENTATKYEVSDYQGETDYPSQTGKVFAGWYEDTDFTKPYLKNTGEAYAKFVDSKVLSVKKQMWIKTINTEGTNSIRFVTAVDSLKYSKVVFHIEVPEQGKSFDLEETTAYSSIMVDGVVNPQKPSEVQGTEEAKYFVLHSLTGIPQEVNDSEFRVTPYWYTLDGKKVAGTTNVFTINEILQEMALFADTVTVNGTDLDSATENWDCTREYERILEGSYASGCSLKPMYFKNTGNTMMLRTTMTYTTEFEAGKSYQGDLMGGLYIHDGTYSGYVGVRQHGVVYSPWMAWIENAWPYCIMSKWDASHMTADVEIILKDGCFYIYMDDVYSTTLDLSTCMPNTSADSQLAFGLTMHADKASDIQFSNIEFTTDESTVETYLNNKRMFVEKVSVNGVTITSPVTNWDLSDTGKAILQGNYNDGAHNNPLYFSTAAKTALVRTTIKNTSEYPLLAGVALQDGITGGYGFLGLWKNLFYVNWTKTPTFHKSYLETLNSEVQFDVALREGQLYVYVDGLYVSTVGVEEVLSGTNSDREFALGLFAYNNKADATFEFSDIQFITDEQIVDAFINGDILIDTYGTGLDENRQYNNKLYGLNQSNDVEGADPGTFYVSPEEDPVWGGYYYMYTTGSTRDEGLEVNLASANAYAFKCYRSKDLYQWELCGTLDDGYSLLVDWADWSMDAFWAPEVIRNPQDGKYYMYFNAASRPDWGSKVEGLSSSTFWADRLYLGVAVSDTPTGPFDVLYDKDKISGYRMPTINFHTGCNTRYDWAAIDASPFFDEDGTLYLYFNKHMDTNYKALKGVWGVKMKSMTEPDYSTVSYLAKPHRVSVSNTPGNVEAIKTIGAYYERAEGDINEAPFMVKHNGKYYLTYASNGFQSLDYSVHQAISDSPLGGFVKLSSGKGNPVLDGSLHGGDSFNYMNGTAHHSIVQNGEEMWIVYHRHTGLEGVTEEQDRSISADRVNFVKNADGLEVLTANGPSLGLQWLPESISGYKNLAQEADITISTGSGKEYLTDGILPFYQVAMNRFMSATSDVTITMKWEEPVSVSSVMVYNAYKKSNTFSEITNLRFRLAEGEKAEYAWIPSLTFPSEYMSNSAGAFIPCAPAVAEIDTLKITELQFTIPVDDQVDVSEIVILGK